MKLYIVIIEIFNYELNHSKRQKENRNKNCLQTRTSWILCVYCCSLVLESIENQLNAFLKEKENIISRFRSQGINIEEFESIMNKFQTYQEKILLSKQKYEEAQQLEQNVIQDKQNRMDQLRQLVYPFSIVEIYL